MQKKWKKFEINCPKMAPFCVLINRIAERSFIMRRMKMDDYKISWTMITYQQWHLWIEKHFFADIWLRVLISQNCNWRNGVLNMRKKDLVVSIIILIVSIPISYLIGTLVIDFFNLDTRVISLLAMSFNTLAIIVAIIGIRNN